MSGVLLQKGSVSRVRGWGRGEGGVGRDGEKPPEAAVLILLPAESYVKGTGVTLRKLAASPEEFLQRQTHCLVLPVWITPAPFRKEVQYECACYYGLYSSSCCLETGLFDEKVKCETAPLSALLFDRGEQKFSSIQHYNITIPC